MKLLFNLGNSNLSWAISAETGWQTGKLTADPKQLADALIRQFATLQAPDAVWMSSVGGKPSLEVLHTWLDRHWSIQPSMVVAEASAFGITNCYPEASTLGADRWAALVAVRHRYKIPACIIDAGTAVTVNLLDDKSHFRGGSIFPGLHVIRQALVSSTANLSADTGSENSCLACTTADAIAAGTRVGWIGAVRQILDAQQAESKSAPFIYITGGDGELLARGLDRQHELVPDLVLQGIDVISELSS